MAELKPGWQRVKFGDVVRLNKETCKDPEAEGIERVIGLDVVSHHVGQQSSSWSRC